MPKQVSHLIELSPVLVKDGEQIQKSRHLVKLSS